MYKTLFGILAAGFLLLGAYNVAKADPVVPSCEGSSIVEMTSRVEGIAKAGPERNARIYKLDDSQKAKILEIFPLSIPEPFDMYVIGVDDAALILISVDGCVKANSQALPRQALENVIGVAYAGDKNG